MNYHIDTGLILQEFKEKSECPLCQIRNIIEEQIVEQFLDEAVMVDSYRKSVNEKGFCPHHYSMLFSRKNKCGLALQTSTRFHSIVKDLKLPKTTKQARAEASTLLKTLDTCVICDIIDFNMKRYFETVAQMFYNEKSFKDLLLSTNGFCIEHYSNLLLASTHAKSKEKDYLETLYNLEVKNNQRILDELKWFCDKFDYRNADKPWGTSEDALIRAIIKLHGKRQD